MSRYSQGNSLDWETAEENLRRAERAYTEIGSSGQLAMMIVITPLRDRFNVGERSKELYEAISNIAL